MQFKMVYFNVGDILCAGGSVGMCGVSLCVKTVENREPPGLSLAMHLSLHAI